MDKPNARRIVDFYGLRIAVAADPRQSKPLKGELGEFWRYRVGDYRVLCGRSEMTEAIYPCRHDWTSPQEVYIEARYAELLMPTTGIMVNTRLTTWFYCLSVLVNQQVVLTIM